MEYEVVFVLKKVVLVLGLVLQHGLVRPCTSTTLGLVKRLYLIPTRTVSTYFLVALVLVLAQYDLVLSTSSMRSTRTKEPYNLMLISNGICKYEGGYAALNKKYMPFFGTVTKLDFREKIHSTETYKLMQCCALDFFLKTRSVTVPSLDFSRIHG